MPKGMVEVTAKFRREVDTSDFVTDEDLDDLEEDGRDAFELSLEDAAARLQEQYESGDLAVQDEPEFDGADISVRVIGG